FYCRLKAVLSCIPSSILAILAYTSAISVYIAAILQQWSGFFTPQACLDYGALLFTRPLHSSAPLKEKKFAFSFTIPTISPWESLLTTLPFCKGGWVFFTKDAFLIPIHLSFACFLQLNMKTTVSTFAIPTIWLFSLGNLCSLLHDSAAMEC